MNTSFSVVHIGLSRRQPLPAAMALALALSPTFSSAAQTVTNCNDSGSGSLRGALAAAVESDTINMTTLTCSKITLGTALVISRNSLTLNGKGLQALTISGNNKSFGVLQHTGTGTLSVNNLSLTDGNYTSGGCIASLGNVALVGVGMSYCTATGVGGKSVGGAVGAVHDVTVSSSVLRKNYATDTTSSGAVTVGGAVAGVNITISNSTITNNSATTGGNIAGGGGVYAVGNLSISNTTLSNNVALDVGGLSSAGGGAFAGGNVTIVGSTFTINDASVGAGLAQGTVGKIVTVTNSTLSDNTGYLGGGMAIAGTLQLNNSTVARNYVGGSYGAAGIEIGANSVFQSSIVANNTAPNASSFADIGSKGVAVTVTGANNLVITAQSSITLPSGTLKSDPKLASFLENNGGPTQTFVLEPGSPAIGTGNNVLRLASDQRGPGFARMTREKTDIGAYQTGDGIFASGFE
jgi:hypothetical protein